MISDVICQPEQQASVKECLATSHRKHTACCSEQELNFLQCDTETPSINDNPN